VSSGLSGWVGAGAAALVNRAVQAYGATRWPEQRLRQLHRRTLTTLVLSQCFGGLGVSIAVAVSALLAEQISGSAELAGLAQTCLVLGTAVASYAIARLMGGRGRRAGLVAGYLTGAAGAGLCVAAGVLRTFPMLLVGAALLGATTASINLSRYAATDLAPPKRRARSLALVVWATTVGAVLGPNLSGPAGRLAHLLGLPRLTGPILVAVAGIAVAAVVLGVFLRPDPLLVAREAVQRMSPRTGGRPPGTSWSMVRQVLAERPVVAAGVAALALAHAVMVAVMVMTPLHMHAQGASLEIIGVVISVHVLGMYAFSPLVGWAADRFGRPTMIGVGAGVLLAALALAGTAPASATYRFGAGLFLLGLGWSCSTVAASTLLSEATPLEARTDVQGAAELTRGLVAAAAGALAGVVEGSLGFAVLALFAAVLVAGVATSAEFARRGSATAVDQPLAL
jgi:MFS family permease